MAHGDGRRAAEHDARKSADRGGRPTARPPTPAPLPAALAAEFDALEGRGMPLQSRTRSYLEDRLDAGLGGVRVHRSSPLPAAFGARALASGDHIVLGPGAAPSLTHEAAHVVQQRRHPQPGRVVQADGPTYEVFTSPTLGTPLARYTVLASKLPADDWAALNAAARQREANQAAGHTVLPDSSARQIREVELTVRDLLWPALARSPASGGFRMRLFDAASSDVQAGRSPDATAMGLIVYEEIVRRWLDRWPGALDLTVRVALVDPDGTTAMPSALTFVVEDTPIDTVDGSLQVGELDALGPDALLSIRQGIDDEASEVTEALQIVADAHAGMRGARATVAREYRDVPHNEVGARIDHMSALVRRIDAVQNGALSGKLSSTRSQLVALRAGALGTYQRDQAAWMEDNQPSQTVGEFFLSGIAQAERDMEAANDLPWYSAWGLRMAAGESQRANYMGLGGSDMVTGGAVSQNAALHRAFREGDVSLATLEEGSEAITRRGTIHAIVFGAVTIGSLFIGGPLIGTGATLARTALVGGGIALGGTWTIMGVNHLVTSQQTFDDPYLQSLWGQGAYSLEQYLTAGAISFGLGAGLSAGAWLMEGGNAAVAQRLALASEQGSNLPAVVGVEAQVVRRGVVEIRVPGQAGFVRATREGWTHFVPAGDSVAPVGSGSWARLATGELEAQMAGRIHGRPFGFAAHDQGWMLLSPQSARAPMQFGAWADDPARALFGPAGSMTGTDLVVLGGPRFVPPSEPLFPPGTVGLPRGGVTGSPAAGAQLLLGGGELPILAPQGFGARPPSDLVRFFPPGGMEPVVLPVQPSTSGPLLLPPPASGLPAYPPTDPLLFLRPTEPSTAIVPWGESGYATLPGHARVRSPSTGVYHRAWRWYEMQSNESLGLPRDLPQTEIQLPTPTQYPGRSTPQNAIRPDQVEPTRQFYGESKMRNWGYGSNVQDLAGSLERMVHASRIEAAPYPNAPNATFYVHVASDLSAPVQREVIGTLSRRLFAQGYTSAEIVDILGRIQFVHQRFVRPP